MRGQPEQPHQQRKRRQQANHELHPGPAVGEVRPQEAHHIAQGRCAADKGHSQVDLAWTDHTGIAFFEQNCSGGALYQSQRQTDQPPGRRLAFIERLDLCRGPCAHP